MADRSHNGVVQAVQSSIAPAQDPIVQIRLLRVSPQTRAHNRAHIFMQQTGIEQFPHDIGDATGGMKLVHIGLTTWIHPRQQRHGARDVVKIRPINDDACGAGNGDQMQGVVGRAARGHQANNGVNNAALVQHFAHANKVFCLGQQCGLYGGLLDQRRAQFGFGVYKCTGRQMQAHEFHQHLVGVGGAVKCARASAVVRGGLTGHQCVATYLAGGIQLTHLGLLIVAYAACHWPCGHKHSWQMAKT